MNSSFHLGCSHFKPHGSLRRIAWVIIGLLLVGNVFGQRDSRAGEDMCELSFHGAAIVNDTWVIRGGRVGYDNGTSQFLAPNTYGRAINLSKQFSLASTSSMGIWSEPENIPTISAGVYWNFNFTLYEVVGQVERVNGDFRRSVEPRNEGQVTIFDALEGKYRTINATNGNGGPLQRVAHPLAAQVPKGRGKGFLLGGVIRTGNETVDQREWAQEEAAWMTVYDHEFATWKQWRSPWQWRTHGTMVYVPIGQNGLLVTLGGYNGTRSSPSSRAGPGTGPMPMDRIDVYNLDFDKADDEPGTWMDTQIATAGDEKIGVPDFRINACSVVKIAPDNSTAQIFLWGGSVPGSVPYQTLDELWVLNLPSFEWYRLSAGSGDRREGQTNPGEREGMTCNAVGKYMLMFGGWKPPHFSRACETSGMYALDMSKGEWIETWPGLQTVEKEAYTIPQKVVDGIGGTIHGINRTDKAKEPVNSWADDRLKAVFDWHSDNRGREDAQYGREPEYSTIGRTEPIETNIPKETPADPEPEPEETPAKLPIAAIAGISVGGAVLLGIAAFAFWMIRRRRASKDDGLDVYGKTELPADEDTAPVRQRCLADSQPVVEADGEEKAAELDDYQKKQAWMLENVFELDGVSPAVERPPQELDAVSPQRGNPRVELDAVSPACSVKLEFF